MAAVVVPNLPTEIWVNQVFPKLIYRKLLLCVRTPPTKSIVSGYLAHCLQAGPRDQAPGTYRITECEVVEV